VKLKLKKSNLPIAVASHLALLIPFFLFVRIRYFDIQEYYSDINLEFNLITMVRVMKYDIAILTIGFLSLIGVLFFRNNKSFFFLSLLFLGTQCITTFLIPSLSLTYFLLVIAAVTLLYLIVWNDLYYVYINKRGVKMIFLLVCTVFDIIGLYYLGIL
jgi:hypothetical protein